jgi:UDP:flavonoid glycosyltransferase YjiC (YdhE family)
LEWALQTDNRPVSRFLVVATAGAGGDLPPLIAASLALRGRGHEFHFLGDRSVERTLRGLGVQVQVLPEALDLGPRLAGAIREAMEAAGGDLAAAGPLVEGRMGEWAREVSASVQPLVSEVRPDAVVTSLFGVEVLKEAAPRCPWAVVNSTFYIGPDPPRPVAHDIGPRAVPLIHRYARLMESADMVLHATDRVFDLSFDRLPPHHHYTGPLGLWEQPIEPPSYLEEPGEPWVLVSISSQLQDDLPLAEAALVALADKPVRVVITVGPDHRPEEISVRPPNAHIEQSVPHSAVLKRGVLLVSHAGHGSVMKALWEGTPMVLVPWGRDQPGVAARAEALGVARVVSREGASPDAISTAIDNALADQEMAARSNRHSTRLRSTDPPARAVEFLEELL